MDRTTKWTQSKRGGSSAPGGAVGMVGHGAPPSAPVHCRGGGRSRVRPGDGRVELAVRWVIDEVIVPRFDEGSVSTSTVVTGISFIICIGVVRATGVVVRRVFATKAMWMIAQTLSSRVVDRFVAQPVSWYARRPDGDLVARAGVDSDAAVSVMAPIPFATGTVVLLVVSTAWMMATDVVPRAPRCLRVSRARRDEHGLRAARRQVLRRRTGPSRCVLCGRARELRRGSADQGVWSGVAGDGAAVGCGRFVA